MSLVPVVIVSYYFPPLGGAGTQRFAKFCKYLPEFGYRPIVVTSQESTAPSAPSADSGLLSDIHGETVIVRVPERPPVPLSLARRAAMALRFRVDMEAWVARAFSHVRKAIVDYSAQALIVTASPYAAAALGPLMKRQFRIPWILDLRDPWALDGWRSYPTWLHARYDFSRMRAALRDADLVVANAPAARQAYLALFGRDADSVWTIPNGFDDADFDQAKESPGASHAASSVFRVVHVGTLHDADPSSGRSRRGWARKTWRRVFHEGRSARYLLMGIAELKRRRPDLYRRIRIELIGHVDPSHERLAQQLGVWDAIDLHPYMPHSETIERLKRADCVFVPLHGVPQDEKALVVPGKLYEALASGRFVLGILPPGDAADLIQLTGAGATCPPGDIPGVARILGELIADWSRGCRRKGAPMEKLAPLRRWCLTRDLAMALDTVRGAATLPPPFDAWQQLRSAGVAADRAGTDQVEPEAHDASQLWGGAIEKCHR